MSPDKILSAIQEITRLAKGELPPGVDGSKSLEAILDQLALAYHSIDERDNQLSDDQVEPSLPDYNSVRTIIAAQYPGLGLYWTVEPHIEPNKSPNILAGDAVDDLADIVRDMLVIEWYWSNAGLAEAMWHFRRGYEHHWGEHLRDLQKYLYSRRFLSV